MRDEKLIGASTRTNGLRFPKGRLLISGVGRRWGEDLTKGSTAEVHVLPGASGRLIDYAPGLACTQTLEGIFTRWTRR